MNLAGVVVHAKPENIALVQSQLETIDGVEVHGAGEDGRMVVTVEEDNDRAAADKIMQFQDLDGVISAAMVYHHFEEC